MASAVRCPKSASKIAASASRRPVRRPRWRSASDTIDDDGDRAEVQPEQPLDGRGHRGAHLRGEGREGVTCVVLGRGASTAKVEQWLEAATSVDGFIGFAIGRSIWWDALKGFLANDLERSQAASQIADNYLHFVKVYERQQVH